MDAILTLFALPRGRIRCGSRTASARGQPESQCAVESEPCPLPSPPPLRKGGSVDVVLVAHQERRESATASEHYSYPPLAQRVREGAATSFDPPRLSACLAHPATSDHHATLSNTTTASVCPAMQRPIM